MLALEKLKFTVSKETVQQWAIRRRKQKVSDEMNAACEALAIATAVTTDAFVILTLGQLQDLGVDLTLAEDAELEPSLWKGIEAGAPA